MPNSSLEYNLKEHSDALTSVMAEAADGAIPQFVLDLLAVPGVVPEALMLCSDSDGQPILVSKNVYDFDYPETKSPVNKHTVLVATPQCCFTVSNFGEKFFTQPQVFTDFASRSDTGMVSFAQRPIEKTEIGDAFITKLDLNKPQHQQSIVQCVSASLGI